MGKEDFSLLLCDINDKINLIFYIMWVLNKLVSAKEIIYEGAVPDKSKWVTWRLVPAQVSDEEIAALERQIGVALPQVLKIFLTTYFHYFGGEVGRNPIENKFSGFLYAWNPILVRNGYLPFGWDNDMYFIRCMDLKNMPDEEKCQIVEIDHEILFDFDTDTTKRDELASKMRPVAENFFIYLKNLLN